MVGGAALDLLPVRFGHAAGQFMPDREVRNRQGQRDEHRLMLLG